MVRETTLRWTVAGGGGGVNVLYWDDISTPAEINERVQAALTALAPSLATTTRAVLDSTGTDRDTATGALTDEFSITSPANINGSGGTSSVPNLAQGLVRLITGTIINGRRLRGRIFIPGMVAGSVAPDGNVASGALANLNAFGAAMDVGGHLHVWHRPRNGAGGQSSAVNTTSAWTEFASQRRRRS